MTPLRAAMTLICLASIFTGSNVWTRRTARHAPIPVLSYQAIVTKSAPERARRSPTTPNEQPIEPRVDLNGNEIDDAVGDYRVDRGGELYEHHSPDTALLHLGPPKV